MVVLITYNLYISTPILKLETTCLHFVIGNWNEASCGMIQRLKLFVELENAHNNRAVR